ncbi:MAG TPA: Maf family protein [Terriglobales bacterium]|nr:Maf family protein [Terriglobales bacterium]
MDLVLASSSPRRQELLRAARIPFIVQASNVPEVIRAGEAPQDYCERLAFDKANAVWQNANQKDIIVLGADTTVVVGEHILEKPQDPHDALRMLRLLSGGSHVVITGVCLLGDGIHDVRSASTTVHVARLSDQELEDYVSSGEPMDKAGAYGIQGMFSRWITRIDGEYPNVVGLPISLVYQMLSSHGFFRGPKP